MPPTMKLELVAVPVTDIDRALEFYTKIGFITDHDVKFEENGGGRFVQLTPSGSACSIVLDYGMSHMKPGSVEGLQVVVEDIEAFKQYFTKLGIEFRGVEEMPWGKFIYFIDPDGNGWAAQQLPDYSQHKEQ